MPSEHQTKQAQAQLHQQELDALTVRLESAEADRAYLLAENRRLLASLFEEQRQRRAIEAALSVAKDAPGIVPAVEVAPEAPVKVKRPRKAKGGGQ